MTIGQSDWPGPETPNPRDADEITPPKSPAELQRPPRRRVLWGFILVLLAAIIAAAVAYPLGRKHGERTYKAEVAASASAEATKRPPSDLYCPLEGSEEARKAIRSVPVVTIDKTPSQRVVIMRRGVVVVVKAELTVDLVVCGNDARVAFEKTPSFSARILMEGGTNSKTAGAGPMLFAVDGAAIDPNRVWFSNGKPQIVACRGNMKIEAGKMSACTRYFDASPPPPTAPTPRPSR